MRRVFGISTMMLIFAGGVLAQVARTPTQGNQPTTQQSQEPAAAGIQALDPGGTAGSLLGGVPTGKPTAGVLPLSMPEALKRGLAYNLGPLLGEHSLQATRGARQLALSQLLPRVTVGVNELQQQVNLEAFGFQGFPGMKTIVGPFNVFDVRAYVSQTVLDFTSLNRYRAEGENVKAVQYSNENIRELVVFVCSNLYLQAAAGSSRIEAAKAQVKTAQVLYNLALDQKAAGVVPGIEVLRAQVELQAQQQRLIVMEAQFAKDKLTLARAIGLPLGQEFNLTDAMSFSPISEISFENALSRAYKERTDYQSAEARLRAAEFDRKAAHAGRLPSISFSADYGIIGQRPWDSHGTFTVATSVRIPIFQGGSVEGRVWQADAVLSQRKAEMDDLRGKIHYDLQKAFLDLKAAADRVQVTQSALKLADDQVQQSEDRFRAGVSSNIEVVQAQEALLTASENWISSLQGHIAAKLALARAIGVSVDAYEQFLRGK
jgi:outer membrane protein TolC